MRELPNGNLLMTTAELEKLPNYSCTLPTGTGEGKVWRRAADYYKQDVKDVWYRGRYGEPYPEGHQYHGQVPIEWRRIEICDGYRIFLRMNDER